MLSTFPSKTMGALLIACILNSAALAADPQASATTLAEATDTSKSPAPRTTQAPSTSQEPTTITTVQKTEKSVTPVIKVSELCEKSLSKFSGKTDSKVLHAACETVSVLPGCESVQGTPIYHFDRKGDTKQPANILVMSLIHGDETPAGSVGRFWMERLQTITPRNNWRVIPMLNPDGVEKKTRTNANKVDINRNFPTQDWSEKAHAYWKKDSKASPRRFPGNVPASEPETLCALKHLEDYKPDFVVSIHTPLKVLDYDGPKVKPPKFDYLPWKSLGHYPGSLGRYMWFERKVPVLTMELKEDLPASNSPWLQLQDIIGVLVGLETMNKKEIESKNP